MKVQIRNDAVVIDGYVNVVERESNPIGLGKKFIERIKAGAFGKSLQRRSNVKVLFNHNPERELASTGAGTATMKEDAVVVIEIIMTVVHFFLIVFMLAKYKEKLIES